MKYFLFILTFILLSCNDNNTVHVKVSNPTTGSGAEFEGLEYSVTQQTYGVFESHYKTVHHGVLDENGEDFFEIKMKKNKGYHLTMATQEDVCYYDDIVYQMNHDSANMHAYFQFVPCGFLKLNVNNVDCQGENDIITFTRNWLTINELGTPVTRYGCYSYSGEFFALPAGWYEYTWEVTKNSNTLFYSDSFFVDIDQYITYEINY